jgi:hypothetical protein
MLHFVLCRVLHVWLYRQAPRRQFTLPHQVRANNIYYFLGLVHIGRYSGAIDQIRLDRISTTDFPVFFYFPIAKIKITKERESGPADVLWPFLVSFVPAALVSSLFPAVKRLCNM